MLSDSHALWQEAEKEVGRARCFASEYDSHNTLVLCPPVWASPRVQAAGHCGVWRDRQL